MADVLVGSGMSPLHRALALLFTSVVSSVYDDNMRALMFDRVPLYRELRMILTLWMVLPQTQGATYLYLHYLHPIIADYEHDLDNLIIHLHAQIKSKGGQYVEVTVAWIYEVLFGQVHQAAQNTTNRDTAEGAQDKPATSESYVSALLSRFRTTPIGNYSEAIPSSFFSFLSMNGKHGGDIIPANLSPEDRIRYVNQQKAKLQEWLHMLDVAARSYPAGDAASRPSSRNSSRRQSAQQSPVGLTYRSPPGARTPTNQDSDYEDLGKDESLQMSAKPSPQRNSSWFWKNRTD